MYTEISLTTRDEKTLPCTQNHIINKVKYNMQHDRRTLKEDK